MTGFWQDFTVQPFDAEQDQASAFIALDQLGVIELVGEENKSFLQGQLTNDLDKLSEQSPLLAAHCDFKGKMWATYRVVQQGEKILLITEKSALAAALAELKKYGVFSKTSIEDASDSYVVVGATGEEAGTLVQSHTGELEVGQTTRFMDGVVYRQQANQYLLILSDESAKQLLSDNNLTLFDNALWQLLEIRAGRPMLTAEAIGQFVPQMVNLQALDAISFSKGCYMGQEVVARTRYLGKNKRALFILEGTSEAPLTGDAQLEVQLGDNWRRAGAVINAVQLSDNKIELTAVLASDSEQKQVFRIRGQENSNLSIKALPYSLEDVEK